jgi:uncharacterized membrane protein
MDGHAFAATGDPDLRIDGFLFMKELAAGLPLESSALFILVRKVAPERVPEELKGGAARF